MPIFKKHNSLPGTDALIKEVQGLECLRLTLSESNNVDLSIPQIVSSTANLIQLDHINSQAPSPMQMQQLGKGLARLHQHKQASYGFEQDNFIGNNPQLNGFMDNWGTFFVERRLGYQIKLIQNQTIKQSFQQILSDNQQRLIDFLNASCEHASLVHGDLWSGNVLFDEGSVWLIDPAVYFADREVDLAMSEMFGGFTLEFYQAYDAVYPRSQEYARKKIVYNLYHYLNHYNLFGNGYLATCYQGFGALQRL